ncbi:MAG: efflux RND transporter periplasmic adaptor subunit [Asticcacaulis sp.]
MRAVPASAGRSLGLACAGLAVVLTLGVSGCSKKPEAKPAVHAALVNYAVVAHSLAPVEITGTGSISAWQEAPVGAEVGGLTAVSLLADEGQTVAQGQPLLKMDDVLLQAQLRQAQATATQNQKAYQRSKTLFGQGYLSQAGLDQAEAAYQSSQAALQTAQTQVSLATVRAPVAGIVVSRKAVLGQIVQAGAELFRIARDGRIELNMEVVESDLQRIKPGMAATVQSEAIGPITGTVRIVTPQVDPATRLGYARISVPWSSGLRPGMFASGHITAGSADALIVPQSAVVFTQNTPGVYVVAPDSHVHLRHITIGVHQGDNVVVRDGVAEGDRVVTTGAGFLNDGDLVKLAAPSAGGEH